jgi:hypothetical protein
MPPLRNYQNLVFSLDKIGVHTSPATISVTLHDAGGGMCDCKILIQLLVLNGMKRLPMVRVGSKKNLHSSLLRGLDPHWHSPMQ